MKESTRILKTFVEGLLDEKDDFIREDAKSILARYEDQVQKEKAKEA